MENQYLQNASHAMMQPAMNNKSNSTTGGWNLKIFRLLTAHNIHLNKWTHTHTHKQQEIWALAKVKICVHCRFIYKSRNSQKKLPSDLCIFVHRPPHYSARRRLTHGCVRDYLRKGADTCIGVELESWAVNEQRLHYRVAHVVSEQQCTYCILYVLSVMLMTRVVQCAAGMNRTS